MQKNSASNLSYKYPILAFMGARDSGKSYELKKRIKTQKRLLIIDPMKEYQKVIKNAVVTDNVSLAFKGLKAGKKVIFHTSIHPEKRAKQFEFLCKAVYHIENYCFVVEEMKLFTSAQKAPEWWSILTLQGKHKRIMIVGSSQRPASIDKDFLSNAAEIVCKRLQFLADAKAVSASMPRTRPEEFMSLTGFQQLHYNGVTGELIRPINKESKGKILI